VRYTMMRDALSKVNQSIFYSISNWGEEGVTEWGALIGNSWRTTQDINDSWDSFTNILDEQ
jgi:alpha-galactosidase